MKKIILLVIIVFGVVSNIDTQNTVPSTNQNTTVKKAQVPTSIFKAIAEDNANLPSSITIHQDPRIEQLIEKYVNRIDNSAPYSGPGFRVQVFSSNNFKTAKIDAQRVERKLQNAFPDQKVYVSFTSPFWKVRIGNFRTIDDAQKFRTEMIAVFPELRKDSYTVKENNIKIN